ncbi:TPA: hypothetical protein QCI64_001524 [Enterobacter asburiae]|nr:hypothetical protein [Enterobacter asburiae]HCR2018670.1 hypothetical protein [Enterobacter asburiae]HCR2025511.1 hypothetical protein [Enterobacter asburiae]HCR2035179.1 hypothetical protein [Enterobacter asburiae]HCR2039331.1 hypothetical protein [Enterobacter asburiae]
MDESRKQFEYEAGQALNLPTSIIELARKGDGYDHAFDSMNIMQPLNGWWYWWKKSRAAIEIELPPAVDGSNVPFAGNAWNAYRVEAVEAIRASGIKVKE